MEHKIENILMNLAINKISLETSFEKIKEIINENYGTYRIVRFSDNPQEDVVCVDLESAEEYVRETNALRGDDFCFIDEETWKPFKTEKESFVFDDEILKKLADGYFAGHIWNSKEEEENTKKGWIIGFRYSQIKK